MRVELTVGQCAFRRVVSAAAEVGRGDRQHVDADAAPAPYITHEAQVRSRTRFDNLTCACCCVTWTTMYKALALGGSLGIWNGPRGSFGQSYCIFVQSLCRGPGVIPAQICLLFVRHVRVCADKVADSNSSMAGSH